MNFFCDEASSLALEETQEFCAAGKDEEMLPDIPSNDDLYVGPDLAPLSSPPSSERRDSGIGDVGIDSLDILGPAESELPRLEVEDNAGYSLLQSFIFAQMSYCKLPLHKLDVPFQYENNEADSK